MNTNNSHRLKKYVELISTKHGGLEGLRDVIEREIKGQIQSGLESAKGANPVKTACEALESLERNREPTIAQVQNLEAIIDAELRPVIDVIGGKYNSMHPLWTELSSDVAICNRLEACMESIGRIELPGHPRLPYGGTGFVIGEGLVMTNRHVAEIFGHGLGTHSLVFKPEAKAAVDFIHEKGTPPDPSSR